MHEFIDLTSRLANFDTRESFYAKSMVGKQLRIGVHSGYNMVAAQVDDQLYLFPREFVNNSQIYAHLFGIMAYRMNRLFIDDIVALRNFTLLELWEASLGNGRENSIKSVVSDTFLTSLSDIFSHNYAFKSERYEYDYSKSTVLRLNFHVRDFSQRYYDFMKISPAFLDVAETTKLSAIRRLWGMPEEAYLVDIKGVL